jgi:hypothetical protein
MKMPMFESLAILTAAGIVACLSLGIISCGGGDESNESELSKCQEGMTCDWICADHDQDPFTDCILGHVCGYSQFAVSPGCQTVTHSNGTSSCSSCNPNANVVGASLQTPGQCPRVVHHSSTYETPGCWFDTCLFGACWHDCFFWCGSCYTTDEWDEVVYDPEPPFGGCP